MTTLKLLSCSRLTHRTCHVRSRSPSCIPLPNGSITSIRISSRIHATAADVTLAVQQTKAVFEPHIDSTLLLQQGVVLLTIAGIGAYWWLKVIPSERAAVARSKLSGELGKYLETLETNEDRKLERWFYTDWLQQREERSKRRAAGSNGRIGNNSSETEKSAAAEVVEEAGKPL